MKNKYGLNIFWMSVLVIAVFILFLLLIIGLSNKPEPITIL